MKPLPGMVASTMMDDALSLNLLLDRANALFGQTEIVSRLPDRSLRRHTYAQWYTRTRRLAAALRALGIRKGDRVATLCWNHHAHLECYFGIPARFSCGTRWRHSGQPGPRYVVRPAWARSWR